jgi:hypothetical protein
MTGLIQLICERENKLMWVERIAGRAVLSSKKT